MRQELRAKDLERAEDAVRAHLEARDPTPAAERLPDVEWAKIEAAAGVKFPPEERDRIVAAFGPPARDVSAEVRKQAEQLRAAFATPLGKALYPEGVDDMDTVLDIYGRPAAFVRSLEGGGDKRTRGRARWLRAFARAWRNAGGKGEGVSHSYDAYSDSECHSYQGDLLLGFCEAYRQLRGRDITEATVHGWLKGSPRNRDRVAHRSLYGSGGILADSEPT